MTAGVVVPKQHWKEKRKKHEGGEGEIASISHLPESFSCSHTNSATFPSTLCFLLPSLSSHVGQSESLRASPQLKPLVWKPTPVTGHSEPSRLSRASSPHYALLHIFFGHTITSWSSSFQAWDALSEPFRSSPILLTILVWVPLPQAEPTKLPLCFPNTFYSTYKVYLYLSSYQSVSSSSTGSGLF